MCSVSQIGKWIICFLMFFLLLVDCNTSLLSWICGCDQYFVNMFCALCLETIWCLRFLYGLFSLHRIFSYCLVKSEKFISRLLHAQSFMVLCCCCNCQLVRIHFRGLSIARIQKFLLCLADRRCPVHVWRNCAQDSYIYC